MKSIEYAFKSYLGSQAREDRESYVHTNNLFMVVDGLGIDSLAETAKEETCRIIPDAFFRHLSDSSSPADALVYAIEEANRKIIEERQKLGEKIAASIGLIYVSDKIMYFTHLGDSRIYSFQDGELNQLTKDHTIMEEDPLAKQKYDDPGALQELTHGLGIHEDPDVQIKRYPLDKRCLIIMTTAGLTDRVSNREIAWISKRLKRPEKIIKALIGLNKRKGSTASLTAGIIKYGGLTKFKRDFLTIYSVFFLLLILLTGGYFLKYGTKNREIEKPVKDQIIVPGERQGGEEGPAEERDLQVQESKKLVLVQPIIPEQQLEQPEDRTEDTSSSLESVVEEQEGEIPEMEDTAGEISADVFDDAYEFIMEWKNAWEITAGEKGDMNRYMSLYSEKFRSGRFNKRTWRIDKEMKNKRKEWIEIGISDVYISGPTKENHIEVRFTMNYRSSNFSSDSKKVLEIVKEENDMKIIGESTY